MTKLGKWKRPTDSKIRAMAAALGIPGASTRAVADLYKSINHKLLGSWK
jgi:hypothetical protein